MKWEDGRRGGVEDRRGSGGLGAPHYIGGGGLGMIIIALIGYFVFHIDPAKLLSAVDTQPPAATAPESAAIASCASDDEACNFADVIHTSADDTWAEIFKAEGKTYRPSTITLYSGGTTTACGYGESAMGPFYCPGDQRVYLDLDFFNQLDQQLGAPGDFAKAYVIAHEVGHHVQNELGVSEAVSQKEQTVSPTEANTLSVKLELQADCYAGVWAKRSNDEKHWIEAGDVDEALNAAAAVGDDTLQKKAQGRVVPDSFTHGTSAMRMKWFKAGFESGSPSSCDTFRPNVG